MQKIKTKIIEFLFFLSAMFSIFAVVLIILFIFAKAIPTINEIGWSSFLLKTRWKPLEGDFGILPMIIGSIYVTAGAIIIGVPIGVMCAVFLARFCPANLYKWIKPCIDLMAGIPSIIYGFFGLAVIVPFIGNIVGGSGKSILAASILLGIMILPTIISISETSIRAVPKTYYEGALALGASHERSVIFVELKAAKSGIFASIVLGIGRVVGETMAVVMVAGNQPVIPDSIFSGTRTLTMNVITELSYAEGLHSDALIATSAVLFVFILIINMSFYAMQSKK